MLTNTHDNIFISDDVALVQRIMKLIKMKNCGAVGAYRIEGYTMQVNTTGDHTCTTKSAKDLAIK